VRPDGLCSPSPAQPDSLHTGVWGSGVVGQARAAGYGMIRLSAIRIHMMVVFTRLGFDRGATVDRHVECN
jgi:hypothetical protein